jgi:hypothetical protein
MERKPCEHIMDSGSPCGSPRLNRGRYCYWHNRLHLEHRFPGNPDYQPPILEDPSSIALALNHVYRAQTRGMIDAKTARHLQASLALAIRITRHIEPPSADHIVTDLDTHSEDAGPARSVTTDICPAPTRSASHAPTPDATAAHPFLKKPPQPDLSERDFTRMIESACAALPLSPQCEKQIAAIVAETSRPL